MTTPQHVIFGTGVIGRTVLAAHQSGRVEVAIGPPDNSLTPNSASHATPIDQALGDTLNTYRH
jgi:hypothetical protein